MTTTTVSTSETNDSHLPLTTTFTAPSSCISDLWLGSTSGKTWMNLGPIMHTECLPSGWQKTNYYSPGICPSGYGVAANKTMLSGTVTETEATCCPTLDGHTYQTRTSSSASESIDCWWSPGPNIVTEFDYTWTKDGKTSTGKTSLSSEDHVNAYGVYIRWQSTDLSSLTTTEPATNTDTTATSTGGATTTADAPASETATDSSGSSGLSTGAKAGIGVGVAAGAILVIALLAFFFVRRKRNRSASPHNSDSMGLTERPPIEMHADHAQEMPASYAQNVSKEQPAQPVQPPQKHLTELPVEADSSELPRSEKWT